MIAHHGELRRSIVYDGSGEAIVERVQVPNPPDVPDERAPMHAVEPRLRNLMSNDLVCASEDLEVPALASLIVRHHIGCIPIVDRIGRAVGVVTKTDLVEHLDMMLQTKPKPIEVRTVKRARDIMMPLPLVLPEGATPAQAASLMLLEDVHHILVVSDAGLLAGIVSTKDLVQWMVESERLADVR